MRLPRERRVRRRERARLRSLPINRLLPNVLTMLALSAGLTSIRYAVQERWEASVLAIVIAAIFDTLDGRIARLLNGQSKFGAELDSLSDVVSFGVAPAIVVYLWIMKDAGSFGWIAVLIFSVCVALRLARFNTKLGDSDLPPYAFNYFTGVPAPAGAGLVLLPLIATLQVGPGIFDYPILVGVWTIAVSLLLVSQLPTFSLKGLRIPQGYVIPLLVGVGLLAASLVTAPWQTLSLIGLLYLLSLPFSYRQFQRLKREARRLHGEAEPSSEGPAAKPSAE